MSDATYIDFTIRKEDKTKFESIDTDYPDTTKDYNNINGIDYITYRFADTKNGELETEQEITIQKIPYDKYSGIDGCDYEWVEHHRIDKQGESIVKEFYLPTYKMVNLEEIIKADKKETIAKLIKSEKEKNKIISWKKQEKILSKLHS